MAINTDLAREHNLHPLVFTILQKRGLTDPETLDRFLKPTSGHFRDPLLMKGMPETVAAIRKARLNGEKILLHGDYDADGISSVALLSKTFSKLGVDHSVFLPTRSKHGYGLSEEGIEEAKKQGADLVLALDCGISSFKEVKKAHDLGLKIYIVDHHRMKPELPQADGIIHPLLEGNNYPFKDFSAAGLAYKLSQALLGNGALEFLELGALGTVTDLVPLLDENRTLVRGGLKQLTENPSVPFQELKRVAALSSRKVRASHLGFIFGPRINAPGRLASPLPALELLLSDSYETASELARQLDGANRERQRVERGMVKKALERAEIEFNWARDRIFFLWDESWHSGVAGIVASRIVEKHKKPALIAAIDRGEAKGSGRSVKNFNLFALLDKHRDEFESFGGHEQAVGFTVKPARLESLRTKLQQSALEFLGGEDFSKEIEVDFKINFRDLDDSFFASVERLEPFGMGNPAPVFLAENIKIKGRPISIKDHLKFWVESQDKIFEVFWPNASEHRLKGEDNIDLIFAVERSFYQGEEKHTLKARQVMKRSS
jgi:single-stranded-DNA-specific exonuclease